MEKERERVKPKGHSGSVGGAPKISVKVGRDAGWKKRRSGRGDDFTRKEANDEHSHALESQQTFCFTSRSKKKKTTGARDQSSGGQAKGAGPRGW